MNVTHKITMDLTRPTNGNRINVVEGDKNSRIVNVHLYENYVSWRVPTDASVLIKWERESGVGGEYSQLSDGSSAWSAVGNILTITLSEESTEYSGNVKFSIALTSGDSQISTFVIVANVHAVANGREGANSGASSTDIAGLQKQIGNLSDLETKNKSNLVAAINEAAKSGGGSGETGEDGGYYTPKVSQPSTATMQMAFTPSKAGMPAVEPVTINLPVGEDSSQNVELDTTLTVAGQAADAKAVGDALKNLSVSGLTTAQVNALDGMFKVAAYDDSKDVSGAYAAFKAAFGLSDTGGEEPEEPDTPEVKTYTITTELVNVTSSNNEASVNEGASYTATLTAADGYELDTVSVLMGGVDVTADVYADGVISIPAVTGNVEIMASAVKEEVEIEAVLPEDGLMAYFDLRSATNSAEWTPTQGDADLFQLKKANTWDEFEDPDQYGAFVGNGTYGGVTLQSRDSAEGEFADMNLGTEFTVVTLAYAPAESGMLGLKDYLGVDGYGAFYPYAPYIKSDDSIASGTRTRNIENKAKANTYHTIVVRVDNKLLEIYWNGNVVHTGNGDDYEDFLRWSDATSIRSIKGRNEGKLTAAAFYNKALTGVEIVELIEYLKTLEVTE